MSYSGWFEDMSRFSAGHQIAVDSITCKPLDLMGVEVTGSTLGIIGMGDIGCKIAQRGKGFDMKILSQQEPEVHV